MKIRAYKEGIAKLKEWSLPTKYQISKSFSLLKYNTDEAVSPLGREQINAMAEKIKCDNFLETFQPEVVCHSPLSRAQDTCRGIFGQRDNDLVLPCLTEMSPIEIFMFKDRVNVRIKEFEDWLDSRPEERFVVVGHSRYFQVMLNAEKVMENCSILKCTFHPPPLVSSSAGKSDMPSEPAMKTEPATGVVEDEGVGGESKLSRWKVEHVLYTLDDINESNRLKQDSATATEQSTA